MALSDILITEGDPQQGILELGAGTLNSPIDMLDKQGMLELVLTGGGATDYAFIG